MKNAHASTAQRLTVMFACAAVLMSLTACQGDDGDRAPAGDNRPSKAADAGGGAHRNGVEKLSAARMYDEGMKANADAGSLRERMTREDAKTDLRLSATDCVGTVDRPQRGSYQIVRKGHDIWVKLDSRFADSLKSSGLSISADRWIHGTGSNPMTKALSSFCHHEQFTDPDTASGNLTKGKVTDVDGLPAVPLVLKSAGRTVTYYVAATGTPSVVKEDSTDLSRAGDLVFSEFGKPVGAKAPTGNVMEAPKR